MTLLQSTILKVDDGTKMIKLKSIGQVCTLIIFFLLICFSGKAQILNVVHWQFSAKKISPTTYEIRATSKIDPQWHIYSQTSNEDLGMPTSFSFEKTKLVSFIGQPKELGSLIEKKEDGAIIRYYQKDVSFIQIVKVKSKLRKTIHINGKVEFMACSDVNGMCLPPDEINFNVVLK